MTSQIPPLLPPGDMPPIRTQLDLHAHWSALMGTPGFSTHTLWLMFVGPDGDVDGPLTRIDHVPARPVQRLLGQLLRTCGDILERNLPSGTTVAFLRSRPGSGPVDEEDVAWATGLLEASVAAGVPCLPVHVANDEQVLVVADDHLRHRATE
jgi:hypothetical protein